MNILYVITGLGLGGAEKVVADLADQMFLKGHEVKIVYLTGPMLVKPKSEQIEVIYLGLNGLKDFFKASAKYLEIVRKFKPDVIHAHMVHANIFARLNRVRTKTPRLICTAHCSNEGGKIRMIAYRLTNSLSNFNSNVSQEAVNALIAKGAFSQQNITTVYNGIDLDKFAMTLNHRISTEANYNFLSVGRFNQQKDYPNLLQAIFKIIRSTNKNLNFSIAGDGELRSKLEELINNLELVNTVSLLGIRHDIPQLLQKADFFILSSKFEGLPTVVIEAMACGTFVIATDCGGTAEIMGDTGILVPPQDPEALANAIEKALTMSSEEIKNNNQKARERVERLFSLDASVKRWLEIYETA